MALIVCATGTRAVYEVERSAALLVMTVPVEAWDDTGGAWVAGTGGLVPADTLRPGFTHLEARTERVVRELVPVDPVPPLTGRPVVRPEPNGRA